jgi:hypothetical protein
MHPINKRYFGNNSGSFVIHFNDGNGTRGGYIVRQTGVARYVVSDGNGNHTVRLAETAGELVGGLPVGVATIRAYNPANDTANLTGATYRIKNVTVKNAGSGYSVGDVLNVLTGTGTGAIFLVNTVSAQGNVQTVSITNQDSYTTLPGTYDAAGRRVLASFNGTTSGTGFQAYATMSLRTANITNAGAGFEVGDPLLTTVSGNYVSAPVVSVASVDQNGSILSVNIVNEGEIADVVTMSGLDYEHVRRLYAFHCITIEGKRLRWRRGDANEVGEVDIQRIT